MLLHKRMKSCYNKLKCTVLYTPFFKDEGRKPIGKSCWYFFEMCSFGYEITEQKGKQMTPKIHIIDAMCGLGKTSAAINYINNDISGARFLYITPYLEEIKRINDACPRKHFYEPQAYGSKLCDIKRLIKQNRNIASTHALFSHFDFEIVELMREKNYILIMDEVADVVHHLQLSSKDRELLSSLTTVDENRLLRWNEEQDNYSGKFDLEKKLCSLRALYHYDDSAVLWMFPVEVFEAFSKIFILTYMFDAQMQRCYYDYKGIDYDYWYVQGNSLDTYKFTDKEQIYIYPDYKSLITVLDSDILNAEGKNEFSLSSSWYKEHPQILERLQDHLNYYFRRKQKTKSSLNMWTTFSTYENQLSGDGYKKGFLACNARATTAYRNKTTLAYTINYYLNPIITNYFTQCGVRVEQDALALSELIQWVFRSAIRDGNPITIYIPSNRMRTLFLNWLDSFSGKI